MIAHKYVALLDLLALASLPAALSIAQRYVAVLDLLALASLPAALSAPALLGPLDHDFLSTLIPVVAATAPEVGDLLNIAHRYGGIGIEPRDDTDPAEAWVNDPKFSALALNATKPAGYDLIYQNLHASTSGLPSYLTVLTLTTYSPSDCATACTTNKDCVSYNLYLERSPSTPPTSPSNRNPTSKTAVRCALYASLLTPQTATNTGQYQLDFHVVIAASNGYTNSAARIVPQGFGPPEPFGARAIDAPSTCKKSYLGLRTFSAGGGQANNATAVRRCAAACEAHNSHNGNNNHSNNNTSSTSAAGSQQPPAVEEQQQSNRPQNRQSPPPPSSRPPPTNGSASPNSPPPPATAAGTPRQCTFFNSYMLYNNSQSTGVWQCALFADVWVGDQATNRGQFRGADRISVGESWGYRRMGMDRDAGPAAGGGGGGGDGRTCTA